MTSTSSSAVRTSITPTSFSVANDSYYFQYSDDFLNVVGSSGYLRANLGSTNKIYLMTDDVYCQKNIHVTTINYDSLESLKSNISKYEENAIDVIKNSEIYIYNFKTEGSGAKKHIGFVIPNEGGNYKTPKEVISSDESGIDGYATCAILWKAIQEQQEVIEQLQEQDKAKDKLIENLTARIEALEKGE